MVDHLPLAEALDELASVCCEQASVLRQRRLSEAASMARLSEVSSLYIPMAPSANLPCVRWGLYAHTEPHSFPSYSLRLAAIFPYRPMQLY